jgi:diguanylate cyclase (GGDEF)-like protein
LQTPDGYNVGALCAIDRDVRAFRPADEALLASFAALVVDELELRIIGQNDHLTGAKTRRAFMDDLEAACTASVEVPGVLIMLDLDHFKHVNDRFGHQAGDEVLRAFAAVCRKVLRRTDVIGRLGGEEFGIILRGMTMRSAMECAERIRAATARLRALPDAEHIVTVSLGIAPVISNDPQGTLGRADAALYRAKASGRNRCCAVHDGASVSFGQQTMAA